MKKLRLFNGRFHEKDAGQVHAYVAAYSRADAVRVITEYLGYKTRGMENELKVYWSETWGNPMIGIEPQRGLWVQLKHMDKPIKRYPEPPQNIK